MEKSVNETDNPLKRLVETSIVDFAEWVLDAEVDHVETANIELHVDPAPIFSDLLFWVTLAQVDGNGDQIRVLLHFEFQGKGTRKPMPYRVLDYIVRITNRERGIRIHSVVFYIGHGVGAKDSGRHQLKGIGDHVTLAWNYDVIRLWQIEPEQLLELKRPGLLPLIGQTKIENPDELIPRVYSEIKSVPDEETQHRLLTELLALLQDKEIVEMVETLVEQDEWVLDTPYIRRWRSRVQEAKNQAQEVEREAQSQILEIQKEAQNQMLEIQKEAQSQMLEVQSQIREVQSQLQEAQGQAESYRIQAEQARKKETDRWLQTRRQDVLNQVALRYNPPMQEGIRLQKYLSAITNDEQFKNIFEAVVHAEDFGQFSAVVEQTAPSQDIAKTV